MDLAFLQLAHLARKKEEGAKDAKVENKDKPVVFFNRQPSNSSTGELDTNTLNFNKDTYYVGFDAVQGAELQGQMVLDYIKAHAAELDRNKDGIIGYVLAIGDIVTMTLSLVLVVSVRHWYWHREGRQDYFRSSRHQHRWLRFCCSGRQA